MIFMKILMVVALFSAVLAKESWAIQRRYEPVPLICGSMGKYLQTASDPMVKKTIDPITKAVNPASGFAYYKRMRASDVSNELYYLNADEKEIEAAYDYLTMEYDGNFTEDELEQACAKKLDQKKLYSKLVARDGANSPEFGKVAAQSVKNKAEAAIEAEKPKGGTCVGVLKNECDEAVPLVLNLTDNFSQWLDYETRRNNIPGPSDSQVTAYDTLDCQCHQEKLKEKGKSTHKMGPEIDMEIEKLKNLIAAESAKKFVNNYAAVSEDMLYIGSAEAEILNYAGGEGISEEAKLCKDPTGFQKAVSELCAKNGTSEGSEERMSKILSTFNPKLNALPFKDALAGLNADIGVLELPQSVLKPGQKSKLLRPDYDRGRFSIGQDASNPQLKFANQIITELLKDSKFEKAILDTVSLGQEPFSAILDLMSDPKNDRAMDKVLKNLDEKFKLFKGKEIFANLGSMKENQMKFGNTLTSKGKQVNLYRNELGVLFSVAMQYSPGFKNLLMDPKLFTGITKKFSKKNHKHMNDGLLGIMRSNKVQLMQTMNDRCEKVQLEFAQNVCAKPEYILNNASTNDVLNLLKSTKYAKSPDEDVVNMALCRLAKNQPNKESVFGDILVVHTNPQMRSDYLNRKLKPDDQDNFNYNVAVMLLDDKNNRWLKNAVNYSTTESSSIGQYKSSATADSNQIFSSKPSVRPAPVASIASSQVSLSDTSSTTSPPASREVASVSASEVAKTIVAPVTSLSSPSAYVPAVSTAPAAPEDAKNIESLDRVSRERLAKELGDSENRTRVREHISSVDEKDAEEIFRLRDQAMKDRQTISELRLQQERDKTESLRGEYEQLKARFDNLEKAGLAQPAPTAQNNVVSGGAGTVTGASAPHFETATLAAPVVSANSTGGRASGLAPSSMSGAATLGDSNNGSSNATGAGSSVTTTATSAGSESRGLALTVTQAVGADGKGSVVEDPNRALINYLTKNEPTEKQLQDLKTSGLVLTEEDIAKDGQKVQTKKTIKFNELSPEAKSLVEKKLAQVKLQEGKRNYSRQALILELFSASMKKSNLNVKKSGSLSF